MKCMRTWVMKIIRGLKYKTAALHHLISSYMMGTFLKFVLCQLKIPKVHAKVIFNTMMDQSTASLGG